MRDHPMPDNLKALTDNFVSTARDLLQNEGRLAAIAFIGRGNDITSIPMEVHGSKDQAAAHIHKVAATLEADFIFTIIEAWMLGKAHARHYDNIMERYGSIGGSPYGIECVMFQLETHEGTWSGTAPQKPLGLSKKKKTFGEVKFEMFDGVGGRFSGLLSKPTGTTNH
jgi:hypothetical protein